MYKNLATKSSQDEKATLGNLKKRIEKFCLFAIIEKIIPLLSI
jgi:hypothetical protein